MTKQQMRSLTIDLAAMGLGCLLLALGINNFLVPFKLSIGGISSIATALFYAVGIPLSVTNLVLNAFLFVFGFRLLGKKSIFKTVYGVLVLSLFLELTTFLPVYTDDLIAATAMGGLIVGVGVGLIVRREGSTGGSDFAALMLHKLIPHISINDFILIIDCVIIASTGIVFGSVTVTCYSVIALVIAIKISDFICVSGKTAKAVYIMSKHSEELAKIIMTEFDRGVTGLRSRGMYSGHENLTLLCVVFPKELPPILKRIKEVDKGAFVVISDVKEVLGEGFGDAK